MIWISINNRYRLSISLILSLSLSSFVVVLKLQKFPKPALTKRFVYTVRRSPYGHKNSRITCWSLYPPTCRFLFNDYGIISTGPTPDSLLIVCNKKTMGKNQAPWHRWRCRYIKLRRSWCVTQSYGVRKRC